jgi:hypothetical protein
MIPSRAETTHAYTCANATKGDASSIDARRIAVFYGAALIGEPVKHGFGIAAAQLMSLHEIGLLCRGCASVNIVLTHTVESPMLVGIDSEDKAGASSSESDELPTSEAAIESLLSLSSQLSGGTARTRVVRENQWEWPALFDAHAFASKISSNSLAEERGEAAAAASGDDGRNTTAADQLLVLYFHNKGATHFADAAGPTTQSSSSSHGKKEPGGRHHRAKSKSSSSLLGKTGGASLGSGFGRRSLYEMAAFHEVSVQHFITLMMMMMAMMMMMVVMIMMMVVVMIMMMVMVMVMMVVMIMMIVMMIRFVPTMVVDRWC